jgi:hypothetical protein
MMNLSPHSWWPTQSQARVKAQLCRLWQLLDLSAHIPMVGLQLV